MVNPEAKVIIPEKANLNRFIFLENNEKETMEGTEFTMNLRTFELFMKMNQLHTRKKDGFFWICLNGEEIGKIFINDKFAKKYEMWKFLPSI